MCRVSLDPRRCCSLDCSQLHGPLSFLLALTSLSEKHLRLAGWDFVA